MKNSNAIDILKMIDELPLNENTKIYIRDYRDYEISKVSFEVTDEGAVIRLHEGEEVKEVEGGEIAE